MSAQRLCPGFTLKAGTPLSRFRFFYSGRGRFVLALLLSLLLHIAVIAIAGGGKGKGKTFGLTVRVSPPPNISVRLATMTDNTMPASPTPALPKQLTPTPEKPEELPVVPPKKISHEVSGDGDPQAVSTPITESAYLSVKNLSRRPVVLFPVDVNFPELSQIPEGGYIHLSLWINEEGKVDAVTLEKTNLPPAIVERAKLTFMQAEFSPGEIKGARVSSHMIIAIEYEQVGLARPVKPPKIPTSAKAPSR